MDLSKIRFLSPFNRQWYRRSGWIFIGLLLLAYSTSFLGLRNFGELVVLVILSGLTILSLLGMVLLFLDGKFAWAGFYLLIAVFAVGVGFSVHASSMLTQDFNNFPL